MRKGLLGSVAVLLLSAGVGFAQSAPPAPAASSDPLSLLTPPGSFKNAPAGCDGGICPAPDCLIGGCCPQCPGPGGRFWATAEYLLWNIRNDHIPALVTTGPATFPVGFLGNPGTVTLIGNGDLDKGTFSGGRFSAGYWFDDCQTWGIMGSFFFLGQRSSQSTVTSDSFPVLARPFFNINSGTQFSEFAAFPGINTGSISVSSPSRLWGIGPNLTCTLCCGCWYRVNLLGGFQYVDLQESVNITETSTFAPTAPFPGLAGNTFVANDHFGTRNQFYGGQVGIGSWFWRGPWFTNVNGLIALGSTHETIDINGNQTAITPTGTTTVPGGLLALPSNSGRFTHDSFAVLPQVNVNFGRMIGEHMSVFLGYSFLYWSRVARPGDQIDPVLNINQIPNFGITGPAAPNRPLVPFKETDFWAQGINFGVGFYW